MRKYAIIKEPKVEIKKVMLYVCEDGCYVFLYNTVADEPCIADYLQDTLEMGEDQCFTDYNIMKEDWIVIEDPLEGCQDDLIRHIRVKGRDIGKPEYGKYEELLNGEWKDIALNE